MRTSTGFVTVERAVDQRELLLAGRLVAEDLRLPFGAAGRGEGGRRDPLDHVILLQAIGDEVADRADLEPVLRARNPSDRRAGPWSRPRA